MTNPLYLPELRGMLAENDAQGLREFCTALHPARTAEFMDGLTADESWRVLQHAELPLKAEIFCFFPEELQVEILEAIDRDEAARFVGDLPPDDRVDLLNEIKPKIVAELMPLVPVEERRDIQRLRAYPEDTAGAEMTTEFARLGEDCTVSKALEEIGRQAEELETIYYIYVVDNEDHLHGLVSARQLLSAMGNPETPIGQLMERDLVTVHVDDDREEVAQKVARYDLLAIPVVDDEHRMLGIITHDDVLDVMVEEAAEDAYRAAAMEPLQESYLGTPLMALTWKRGVWLTILFFAAQLTVWVLREGQGTLASVPWLVFFLPLVISTGGNSGSQSAALVITALTAGEIHLGDWWRVVRRELAMGFLLGGFLGVCGYFCALVAAPDQVSPTAALVLPITLVLVILWGTLAGSLLPMLFRRLGWDPALMSNPFVAGLNDLVGTVIYLNVAMAVL